MTILQFCTIYDLMRMRVSHLFRTNVTNFWKVIKVCHDIFYSENLLHWFLRQANMLQFPPRSTILLNNVEKYTSHWFYDRFQIADLSLIEVAASNNILEREEMKWNLSWVRDIVINGLSFANEAYNWDETRRIDAAQCRLIVNDAFDAQIVLSYFSKVHTVVLTSEFQGVFDWKTFWNSKVAEVHTLYYFNKTRFAKDTQEHYISKLHTLIYLLRSVKYLHFESAEILYDQQYGITNKQSILYSDLLFVQFQDTYKSKHDAFRCTTIIMPNMPPKWKNMFESYGTKVHNVFSYDTDIEYFRKWTTCSKI